MQNSLLWMGYGMIAGGIVLLAMALVPVRKIIQQLHPANTFCGVLGSSARTRWKILSILIFMFIVGYLLYALFYIPGYINSIADMVVPGIFFGGAIFVFLVCSLSLRTTLDLRQMYVHEQESITDPLTGMYNRRYLDRRLSEELQRARRYEVPFSIFLLDIDYFKKVNDVYGHQLGDMVLQKLRTVIVDSVRELDVVVRYGGEEILVILPSTKVEAALELAERLRQNIEETMMVEPDPDKERPPGMDAPVPLASGMEKERSAISVTVSIGVAGYRFSDEPDTADMIIQRADQALYQAKGQGRNRVVSSNGDDEPS